MIRRVFAIALLVTAVCVAAGEDKDPIKEKLFAAKVAYDKEMRQFRKQIEEWLNKREETARKAGDKKTLDQVKEDRKAYEENDELPKSMPKTLQLAPERAKKKLEAAYAEAVKEYTKAKKDELATAVEKEWKAFSSKSNAGAIDLLARVDPKTHAVAGDWKLDGKMLVVAADDNVLARLQLPYEPGEEYDLEVKCKRTAGTDSFNVGLVAGGQQVLAVTDGWPPNHVSGLNLVDSKWALDNVTMVKGELVKSDVSHTYTYSVRSGKIDTALDGKAVISFKGDFTRLSLSKGTGIPNKQALFLFVGPKTSFLIDRIVVTPVKGKGTILK